ncbi:MAG: hypothetical protein WCF18_19125 [Chthoniobacteraceae bacterium]
MIAPDTGEVGFHDGLHVRADDQLTAVLATLENSGPLPSIPLPIPGWHQHRLGLHASERGTFEVELVSGPAARVHLVFLAHSHPFYRADTPEDSERRAYHDGVIATDLRGQREFAWGEVFQRLETDGRKSWLIISYAQGPQVPGSLFHKLLQLREHEPEPQ